MVRVTFGFRNGTTMSVDLAEFNYERNSLGQRVITWTNIASEPGRYQWPELKFVDMDEIIWVTTRETE